MHACMHACMHSHAHTNTHTHAHTHTHTHTTNALGHRGSHARRVLSVGNARRQGEPRGRSAGEQNEVDGRHSRPAAVAPLRL